MSSEHAVRESVTATFIDAATLDAPVLEAQLPVLYEELRALARRQLGRERGQVTLQPTELLHEAYFRLIDDERVTRRGRAYFFAAAARAMRHVLIDAARRRRAVRRGGGAVPVTLDERTTAVEAYAEELFELNEALEALAREQPRQARVVECRYFGGLSVEETAEALEVSPRTVKSDWAEARAWLYGRLHPAAGD